MWLSLIGGAFCLAAKAADIQYFPSDYATARERFLSRAQLIQQGDSSVTLRSFHVPSQVDDQLYVDALYAPPKINKDTLLILTSGVHGMEAFAGSAVQEMFFNEYWSQLKRDSVGVAVVHALNPFGFKYHRRVTEHNINLNRNFSTQQEMYSHINEGYEKIAEILAPTGHVSSRTGAFIGRAFDLVNELLFGDFDLKQLSEAIGQGQYAYPKGVEYGGRGPEPQTDFLISYLRELIPAYQQILLFDIHTGLGEELQLHLMPPDSSEGFDAYLAKKLFIKSKDKSIYQYTPSDTDGFYHVYGDLTNLLPQIKSPEQKVLSATLEFGTIGTGALNQLHTVNRLVQENQGFHYGYMNEALEIEVMQDFSDLFNPDDPTWRKNVIRRSREFFKRLVSRI